MSRDFNKPVFDRARLNLPHPSAGAPQAAGSLLLGGTGAGVKGLRQVSLSRVRLRRAATQSIADTTDVAINWDTTTVDTDQYNPLLTSTITIPFSGQYLVIANTRFATDAAGTLREIFAKNNGTAIPNLVDYRLPVSVNTPCSISGMQSFTIADALQIFVRHNAGHALNITDADVQLVYLGPS